MNANAPLGLFPRITLAIGLLALVMIAATCDNVSDALGLSFSPDSCVEFHFWRNDTLLVKRLEIGITRGKLETGPSSCRLQNWDFEDSESWMYYGLDEFDAICDVFDAEVHSGNRYWEVTTGDRTTSGPPFAEGSWKLHEVKNNVDKIIDGGTFEFEFIDLDQCN